jgi:ATP-dependent exoDNAse (exonuclease V) alpha subunit
VVRAKNFEYMVETVNAGTPVAVIQATGKGRCHTSSGSNGEAMQLHNKVYLAIGARVMLSKNIAVPFKLVNGSFGIVKQIVYKPGTAPPSQPMYGMVEFPSYNGPAWDPENPKYVPIAPITGDCVEHNRTCSRTQIPVDVAEAMTIHKVHT